ncbi:coronin-7 [Centruroides vittatus]|uniref:coronin-7 n=1 Tax=Centruroides vittatus TaxID=120091 RepID=UPI00350EB231
MWRFKPSKYKNAAPKVPKKGEGWILDLPVGDPRSFGNHIKASAGFMVFNVELGEGNLGILPIDETGKKNKPPLLHAHSGPVTDFDFSPFDDGLLVTCSEDSNVKVWQIPESGQIPRNSIANFSVPNDKPQVIGWHPTVDCLLTMSADKSLKIWDVTKQEQLYSDHKDLIHSFSWKSDGSTVISSGKDCLLQIWDPRCSESVSETKGHLNNRDSRVIWLGDTDYVLSTGFGSAKNVEVVIRDVRNIDKILAKSGFDLSLNIFVPLFDPDTNMLFLAAKAETVVHYWEVVYREPYFVEATKHIGDIQTKGIALVPKRALNVMQAEVNRILLLGQDCIVPISYQVPRKSYREYHSDLYPDTKGTEPALHVDDWSKGDTKKVSTVSLNPQKSLGHKLLKFGHKFQTCEEKSERKNSIEFAPFKPPSDETVEMKISEKCDFTSSFNVFKKIESEEIPYNSLMEKSSANIAKPTVPPKPPRHGKTSVESQVRDFEYQNKVKNVQVVIEEKPRDSSSANIILEDIIEKMNNLEMQQKKTNSQLVASPTPQRNTRTFGVRTTKFRHLNGTILHKNTHITNITNYNKNLSGECDVFHANPSRVALPLNIAGGHIAILELSKPGRLSTGKLPSIVCGSNIADFAWDPFNDCRLVIASDSGKIFVCLIPEEGLEGETSPDEEFVAGNDKISIVKFHSVARDVIITASYDFSIKVWDLITKNVYITLQGHTDQVFTLAWSQDGQYLATVCKDQKLRIYNPRKSCMPIKEGPGPSGKRGARVTWVLGGSHLVVCGFSKVSERQIMLYSKDDLSEPLATEGINVNPSILIPFYDESSSTLFLTGKGESVIFAYEVSTEASHFYPLSHYKCSGPHQAVSFLPKYVCNIAEVEFARAVRLTNTTIEPLSFTVPRLRTEYFQDDLFPDVQVTWEAAMSSQDWFSGANIKPKFISLKPEGMLPLSEATQKPTVSPVSAPQEEIIQFEGHAVLESSLAFLTGNKEKEEQIISSMKDKMNYQDEKLPQDSFEGVDPDEWDEDN